MLFLVVMVIIFDNYIVTSMLFEVVSGALESVHTSIAVICFELVNFNPIFIAQISLDGR